MTERRDHQPDRRRGMRAREAVAMTLGAVAIVIAMVSQVEVSHYAGRATHAHDQLVKSQAVAAALKTNAQSYRNQLLRAGVRPVGADPNDLADTLTSQLGLPSLPAGTNASLSPSPHPSAVIVTGPAGPGGGSGPTGAPGPSGPSGPSGPAAHPSSAHPSTVHPTPTTAPPSAVTSVNPTPAPSIHGSACLDAQGLFHICRPT